MKFLLPLLASLGLLSLLGNSSGAEDKTPGDLEGTWLCVSGEIRGESTDKENGCKWTFTGNKVYIDDFPGATERAVGTFKVNNEANPKELTITWEKGADECNGKTRIAIYEVKGETLKLCFALKDKTKRPTSFKTTTDSESVLHTYKLEKPKK